MDQFIRYYFVYCCYVPNELCHCTNYSGLYCITLCFHQIKKTWCKLGILYTISTFHHSTQICPISDKSWRSCQKFQVQWHLCAQMLSWLELQLKGNPWLILNLDQNWEPYLNSMNIYSSILRPNKLMGNNLTLNLKKRFWSLQFQNKINNSTQYMGT